MRELLREEKLNTQIQLFGGLPFFRFLYTTYLGLPKWHSVKNSPANTGDARQVRSLARKIPCSRKYQPTSVFLPGNPMDRGAWRTTGHGVTKSLF